MKYLLFLSFVLLTNGNVKAQSKSLTQTSKTIQKPFSDSTKGGDTLLILNLKDTKALLYWIDNLHADHQEIKQAESLIQSHIVVYPADKPKK